MPIYRSPFYDPAENLAYEQAILQSEARSRTLLLWRNRDAVIVGRNQNPWRECRIRTMKTEGVSFFRRQSGGGAVYHDEGNLNMTFFSAREDYEPSENAAIVLEALKRLGITAERGTQNDLVAGGRKISGSAFRLERRKAYHHLTLLCHADLGRLASFLSAEAPGFRELRGTASRPAPVANLSDFRSGLRIEEVEACVASMFAEKWGEDGASEGPSFERERGRHRETLLSWEWRYEKTPDFSVEIPDAASKRAEYRVKIQKSRIAALLELQDGVFRTRLSSPLVGIALPFAELPSLNAHELDLLERVAAVLER